MLTFCVLITNILHFLKAIRKHPYFSPINADYPNKTPPHGSILFKTTKASRRSMSLFHVACHGYRRTPKKKEKQWIKKGGERGGVWHFHIKAERLANSLITRLRFADNLQSGNIISCSPRLQKRRRKKRVAKSDTSISPN